MQKIQRVSKGMVYILTGALLVTEVLIIVFLFYPELLVQPFFDAGIIASRNPKLANWQSVAMAGLAVLGMVPAFYVLLYFRALFRQFAAGKIFTATATNYLFKAAIGMIVGGVVAIANTTIGGLILTANYAQGQHVFAVSVSSTQLAWILAGLILAVISWVMQEAARLSEENAGFV